MVPSLSLDAAMRAVRLAAGVAVAFATCDGTAQTVARLTIAPDHYAVGTARFGDLDGARRWATEQGADVGVIEHCPAAGAPVVLAAVERFYPPRGGTLELRALPAGAASCGPATPATWTGRIPSTEFLATDARGTSLLP